ncbi:MAG: hypothetical protein R2824_28415 [Saprospiraceae bacterium]|nr:hypothetical protein [Lewinella sp.]
MELNLTEAPSIPQTKLAYAYQHDPFEAIGMKSLPFKTYFSFGPLIDHLEEKVNSEYPGEALIAQMILEKIDEVPELRRPIQDLNELEEHRELIETMMLLFLPPTGRASMLAKMTPPFSMRSVYITPAMQDLMDHNEVNLILPDIMDKIYCTRVIKACTFILQKFYDQQIIDDQLFSITVRDPKTGLTRFFKTSMNLDFIDIKANKPLKPLSQLQINKMLSNIYDIELWLEHLPPENFTFQGFMMGHMTDITEEESLSRIKFKLLGQNAVTDQKNVLALEDLMRIYFRQPDLRMGITAIDYPSSRMVGHRYRIRFDFLAEKHECLLNAANANSIYEKVCKYREVLLVEDLNTIRKKTPIERDLLKEGIQSIIVAPLKNKKGDIIGLLEIGSPTPFKLHSFVELKFKEIIDLFATAVERSRDEVDNRIEAIIREKYTAVHPSVEWKFVENAFEILENRENDVNKEPPPIIFENVFPLYGQADIVGSSDIRNQAIQEDLRANLQQAAGTIKRSLQVLAYPLLEQMLMYIEKDLKVLDGEFNSSDESRIIELLQSEVHPLFRQISANHPELAGFISSYFSRLDPDFLIVYNKRRAYEDSVSLLNRRISKYLDAEQRKMQQLLPHYFEKYKTDGVEYDLYIGQSLLRNGVFSELHLQNFRLWQLIHMCEITRLVEELQPRLEVPLTTAQLIFAYTNALSIRFRMDDKQFDVDGAYNVRYEILKKRIDKATVNGTDERLTQAGKVAIVYLQEKDRQEYRKYIEYLQHKGYITDEVEELDINRLQSVQGLKALRVTVK